MRIFSSLYAHVMRWSAHPRAVWFLGGLSFAESSFFPIPPDVMLAPMALARREAAWRYAAVASVASVLGGLFGYLIGMFAFELIEPWLRQTDYWSNYLTAKTWFETYGVWIVFIAGFSPVPYKVFTITAGVVAMSLPGFLLASFIGRGARFFLVAGLMVAGGARMEKILRTYIDVLGWLILLIALFWYLIHRYY